VTLTDRRPPFRFAHRLRVGYDETDAQGIVYYGRYMPYFDRARVEYLRYLDLLRREGPGDFVMRAQSVEYHAPAVFDDELEIFVRTARIGRTSLTWAFAAYNVADGRFLAAAEQTMVQVELAARRPVAITEADRRRVEHFERELERR
jgi:acyl-CoA thioester hydrolase